MSVQGLKLSGVMIVALLLGACSSVSERGEPYSPPQYAEPDNQCSDIAGSYNALPHALDKQQQVARPLLALTLLPATKRLEEAQKVTLEQGTDGAWQVMALGQNNALLAKRRYSADSGVFSCDDGQLVFHTDKLAVKPAGVPWKSVVLRKTEDRSLILRKGGLFSGLVFMVFPMSVSTDDWYLFKPVP